MEQDKSPPPQVTYRVNKQGRKVLYIQRSPEELDELLRARLGHLYGYRPLPRDHELIPHLSEKNVIVTVDSMATACRIALTRILYGSPTRRHLFLDGLRLISIRLGSDPSLSPSSFANSFDTFDDLYLTFGFVEVQNKLNQETLLSVVDRRLLYGKDCWLFVPPQEELSRRYGVSLESIRYKFPVLSLMERSVVGSIDTSNKPSKSPPSTFAEDMGHYVPKKRRRYGGES